MQKGTRVFVTGGKGFVGRRVVELLSSRGAECRTYDLADGEDIRDAYGLEQAMSDFGPTAVLHLAARAGARLGEIHPDEYVSTNVTGTMNVVRAAERHVNVLVSFSSSSVLGGTDGDAPLSEGDPHAPTSVYGWTKCAGEHVVRCSSVPLRAVVRPFSVYGESGRRDMVVYRWIEAAREGRPVSFYGDGSSSRGYTYVGDVASGTSDLLASDFLRGGGFRLVHLGGTERVTLERLWEIFSDECGRAGLPVERVRSERSGWDIEHSFSDPTLVREALPSWNPEPAFESTLRRIVRNELDKR